MAHSWTHLYRILAKVRPCLSQGRQRSRACVCTLLLLEKAVSLWQLGVWEDGHTIRESVKPEKPSEIPKCNP